jgi:hypothetical protein
MTGRTSLLLLLLLLLLLPLVPLLLLLLLQFDGGALTYGWGHLQRNGKIKRIHTPRSLKY